MILTRAGLRDKVMEGGEGQMAHWMAGARLCVLLFLPDSSRRLLLSAGKIHHILPINHTVRISCVRGLILSER